MQDSLILSLSKKRDDLEIAEIMRQMQRQCSYKDSRVAFNYAHSYFKSLHTILDFSSIGRESVLYHLITKEQKINETMITILARFRKNSSLYYKSEINCMNALNYFATSPKQYNLNVSKRELSFTNADKNLDEQIQPLHETCTDKCNSDLLENANFQSILKIKGLKRSLADRLVTASDFEKVTKRNCPPKRVLQHTIQRKDRKIYIVAQNKISLTYLCTKQYFSEAYKNKRCFFSFPLYLKSLLET